MPDDEKELAHIRNIGIMAHIDAGKTTTTERMLHKSGEKHKVGDVDTGDTTTDYDSQERERGITIYSAAVTITWQSPDNPQVHQINIIDTPGHVDFTAEVERSLRVLDGGIVVLDGKKGMDGVDNEEKFTDCLKSLRDKLRAKTLVVQFPIGAGKELKGIVDVVKQKAYYFQLGDQAENYHAEEIPTNLIARTQQYRQELIEKLVEGEMERISQDCTKKIKKINEEADQKIKEAK
ncbi:23434_t:CDS:2, partial [Racocetra persica]